MEDIRDTKVDLGLRDVHQKKTLECLMRSYYYMKQDFKMCFTYLAVFPKGFIMDSGRLIQQWIALGYIHAEGDGERCINYLLGMSFLQISRSSSVSPDPVHANVPRELTIHDFVHDLALTITANEFLVLDGNAAKPRTWNKAPYCRHAQLIKHQNKSKVFRDLPAKVRSLHFGDSAKLQLPQKAFSVVKYLRVLDLSGRSVGGKSTPGNLNLSVCSIEGQSTPKNIVLPSSILKSKLLRYLDATALPITSLPKNFYKLQYMQTLILSKCSLKSLPDNICRLHKLCYFDLSGNSSLNKLPMSLGNLSKLSFFNLSGCFVLQEIPESICELTSLRHLDMSGCRAIQNLPDNFGGLRNLIFLNLSGCSKLTKLPDSINVELSLKHLDMSSCHKLASQLPRYIFDLKNLVFLNLSNSYKGSRPLVYLCILKNLKDLDLSDCHDMRELPARFGNLSELKYLNLRSCAKLRLLPDSFCMLFKLRHLDLSYCTGLEKLPSSFGVLKLQTLDISAASSLHDLPDSIGGMTSLTQLEVRAVKPVVFEKAQEIKRRLNLMERTVYSVHGTDNGGCSSIVELAKLNCRELEVNRLGNFRHAEDAERAKLRDKSDLRTLALCWELQGDEGKSILERLIPPRTLDKFFLYGYMSKDFPKWMSHIFSYLPFLNFLELSHLGTCDTVPPFGRLPNLRSLHMKNIPSIRKVGEEFYGEGGSCKKLRVLYLESMENLLEWYTKQPGEENKEFLLPNLHQLQVNNCPKLRFLPYPPRSMFWFLDNSVGVLPQGGFGELSSSTLPFQMSISNCNFSPDCPDEWNILQHITTLESFQIESCSGLRTLPEAIRCFTYLTELYLISLEELEARPEGIGRLISLQKLHIKDCSSLTSLPESMKNLRALTDLRLNGCKGWKTLPEGIGHLTSLKQLIINDFSSLTSLPESMKNLTALTVLWLNECKGIETLPEWLGHLTSLQKLMIKDCSSLSSLPKSMKNLTALTKLWLKECGDIKTLPEGIGHLTSLQEFYIINCSKLTSLPESIHNLTAMKKLEIVGCPSLVKRCQGEDAGIISHT